MVSATCLTFRAIDSSTAVETMLGVGGRQVELDSPSKITFSVDATALLDSSDISVELIINGYPVSEMLVVGDGSPSDVPFEQKSEESSWAAIRIFPHAHANPIYVVVDEQPIRGSVHSARWCLAGVKQCWKSIQNTYAINEQFDAKATYDRARYVFKRLIREGAH